MTPTPAAPPAKRSVLFWGAIIGVGTCGFCSLATVGLMVLGAFADVKPSSSGGGGGPVTTVAAKGVLPTGETPDLFPGSPGFLPSGRGLVIPEAEVVDGAPRGLWWYPQIRSAGRSVSVKEIYLEDGTWASNPRPGGPLLFDLEGQKKQRGSTGVGTFSVDGSNITRAHDGFTNTDPLTSGEDGEGPWFSVGAGRRRPLAPPEREQLLGKWNSHQGSQYEFLDDGSFKGGFITDQVVGGMGGTWVLDGYLLQISPANGPSWITTVGSTVNGQFLVIGEYTFSRE